LAFILGKPPLRGPGVGLPDVLRATEYGEHFAIIFGILSSYC
jgi:hypothetical protein